MPALPRIPLAVSLALVAVGLLTALGIVLVVANTQSDNNDQTIVRYVDCRQGLFGEEELQEYLDAPFEHQGVEYREDGVYKIPWVYSEEIKGYVYEPPNAPDFDWPKFPAVDTPEVQGQEFPPIVAPEFDWPKFPAGDAPEIQGSEFPTIVGPGFEVLSSPAMDAPEMQGPKFPPMGAPEFDWRESPVPDALEIQAPESTMMRALESDWRDFPRKKITKAEWSELPVLDDPRLVRMESWGLFDPELELRGTAKGAAWRNGNSTIVAYVNGLPVTKADIEISRLEHTWSNEFTRDVISRWGPGVLLQAGPDGVISTEGESSQIPGQPSLVPDNNEPLEPQKAFIERAERYGTDTVLLATAVSKLAKFTAATEAGHICDDADIAAGVAQRKTLLAGGKAAEAKGYISAVGEDVYFNEVLPRQIAQFESVQSWQREISGDGFLPGDPPVEWDLATKDAYLNARVTLTDDWYMDATLDDAKAYMEESWDFYIPATP